MGVQLAVPGASPEEPDRWLLMAGREMGEVLLGGGSSRTSLAWWEGRVGALSPVAVAAPGAGESLRGLMPTGAVMSCTVSEVLVLCVCVLDWALQSLQV